MKKWTAVLRGVTLLQVSLGLRTKKQLRKKKTSNEKKICLTEANINLLHIFCVFFFKDHIYFRIFNTQDA